MHLQRAPLEPVRGVLVVLVISTFKVANGMETAVRQAFLDRPGLVEDAPGFLGMEVSVDHQDGCIFQLLTRWTDEASFRSWHSGPVHKLAHRGIPKGLKLDPSHTVVRVFDVLPGCAAQPPAQTADAPIVDLPHFLALIRSLHWLRATFDGGIAAANPAFEWLLRESGGLAGQSLWDRMTEADAASIQAILQSEDPSTEGLVLLNFVDRDNSVHTLECHLEVHREDFVLVGEPVREDDRALAGELMDLNNRWALLVRENGRNVKALRQANEALEKAMADLNQSHWHLRKIQETLPICMYCGKVKTGDARWEGVVEYLKANSLFLSHGCCPGCLTLMWGDQVADAER
jgi:heme-degrading monooxygenase HmoA